MKQVDIGNATRVEHNLSGHQGHAMSMRRIGSSLEIKVEWVDDGEGDAVWCSLENFSILGNDTEIRSILDSFAEKTNRLKQSYELVNLCCRKLQLGIATKMITVEEQISITTEYGKVPIQHCPFCGEVLGEL